MRFNFKVHTTAGHPTNDGASLTLLFFCLVFQRSRDGLPQGQFVVHGRRQHRDRPRGQSDIEIRSQKVRAQPENRVPRDVYACNSFIFSSNLSCTLPVESSHNYEQIALSPDSTLLFAVNEGTYCERFRKHIFFR